MKSINIDSAFFELNRAECNGLIEALLLLKSRGYVVAADGFPDRILQITNNEGIVITSFRQHEQVEMNFVLSDNGYENQIIITSEGEYINILEAVKSFVQTDRRASLERATKETKIKVDLNLDGTGESVISTGIGFFDHMLDQIARHGNIDLHVKVEGDLHVDEHHTVEDTGIALGEAILNALGEKKGIKRYGYFLPMDDTITKFAIDIGGRQYLNFKCKFDREFVGEFPTELTEEFFKGIAQGLKANVFVRAKGKNDHHKIEAIFKAFAKSLNEACRLDERAKGKLPTTKGLI